MDCVLGDWGCGDVGRVGWETYAGIETKDAIGLEDVHECAEHALGTIWGACLKADLLGVS